MTPGRRPRDGARRIVFVTVGTDHHPFHRLVSWADAWLARRFEVDGFIQFGTSRRPESASCAAYLDQHEMSSRVRTADFVVCHGGPVTIMSSLDAGKKPIVAPRRSRFGEHVDDHQVRFTSRLGASGLVVLAETEEGFNRIMDDAIAGALDLRAEPRGERLENTIRHVERILDPLVLGQ